MGFESQDSSNYLYQIRFQSPGGAPQGTRTPVYAVRGRYPGPLDEGSGSAAPRHHAPMPIMRMLSSRFEMVLNRRDIALDMAARLRIRARDARGAARSPGPAGRIGLLQVSIAASLP